MSSKIGIIIRREYLERVRKKSFIITTLLMPVITILLMMAPALILLFNDGKETKIAVIDESGRIAQQLEPTETLKFTVVNEPLDEARADESFDAVAYIPANILEKGATMQFYSNEASSINLEGELTGQVNRAVENIRMRQFNIEGLDKILDSVKSDVGFENFRNDRDEGENQTSTALSYVLGVVLTLLLYMCLLIYGQMVMTSIIEEKNNRVLEIVVSSVKPAQLMLGKICGICLVAVTQIVIWGILISVGSAVVMPALISPEVAADMAAANAGASAASLQTDADLLAALSLLGNVGYIVKLFSLLVLFLVGGFMLYAAIYAAIGSAVDNIQDASQLQSFVVIPVILGIMFGMAAASDPSSQLSVWMSFVPFTSPMVMMARIPFGIPDWQIAISLVILYLSFFAMVWVAAKIYRIGIFMYGKKPTMKELIRWARYK